MTAFMEESSCSSNYTYSYFGPDSEKFYRKSQGTKDESTVPTRRNLNAMNKIERRRLNDHTRMAVLFVLLLFYFDIRAQVAEAVPSSSVAVHSRCYSCASTNMKENFLTRNRGPKRRKQEPKVFDDLCDLDSWMIREKSAVECDGSCYKWQQVLNNSGVYSYATIRGCYSRMFDLTSPMTAPEKPYNECTARELPFECLDQSSLMEWECFCNGDYCNKAISSPVSNRVLSIILVPLLLIFFRY